jgi:hypothetical protein
MTRRETLRRYRHLRAIVTDHHGAALEFVAEDTILEHAKRLGMAAGGTLVFEDEKQLTLLYDLALYTARVGRSRAIDRYARAAQLPVGSDESLVLEALRLARFSIWRIERRHDLTGLILTDLRDGNEFWLIDENLRASAANGWVFAARILQPENFVMTNGVIVPVQPQTVERLMPHVQAPPPCDQRGATGESRLTTEVYREAIDNDLMDRIALR